MDARGLQRPSTGPVARSDVMGNDGCHLSRITHEVVMATRRRTDPGADQVVRGPAGADAVARHMADPVALADAQPRAERLDLIEFVWSGPVGIQAVLYVERRFLH